jgi:hypothetical protein
MTAVTQVQRQISELRKTLGSPKLIETQLPGYAIRLGSGQLDLDRFERKAGEGGAALDRGQAEIAAELLREADELSGFPHMGVGRIPLESITKDTGTCVSGMTRSCTPGGGRRPEPHHR